MDVLFTEAERLGLNGREAVEAARNPRLLISLPGLLGYSDLSTTGTMRAVTRRYRFCLFHLEMIAAYRSVTSDVFTAEGLQAVSGSRFAKGFLPPTYEREWEPAADEDRLDKRLKRAEKAAGRILYMLGLDYGVVDIGIGADGKPVLLGVEPYPELEQSAALAFGVALAKYREGRAEESGRSLDATLGADPEFLLMNAEGQVVPASAYLPRRGLAGCDHVRIGERLLYPLAELRPDPSPDPGKLFASIRKALYRAAEHIPDRPGMRWLAGGMPARGFALGGHIHLSGLWLNSSLLRVLDNYLALPLMLIEDGRSQARRPRYGAPGDVRRQPHGGFEYRTLPSWLVTPVITKGVLGLAALLSSSYRGLHQRPLRNFELLRAYYEGDKPRLADAVKPLIDELYGLDGYRRYEQMVSPFLRMVRLGISWDESRDIRMGWKIGPWKER
jgi:hypothetical protein